MKRNLGFLALAAFVAALVLETTAPATAGLFGHHHRHHRGHHHHHAHHAKHR